MFYAISKIKNDSNLQKYRAKNVFHNYYCTVDNMGIAIDGSLEELKAKKCEEVVPPNKPLPWQQLLMAAPQQVMVVERMHSGARRFVILDFGQPILLTDLLIPSCNDLVCISIDVWFESEEVDGLRLVVSPDIGGKDLILNDLQPPPLCRYLKVGIILRVLIY